MNRYAAYGLTIDSDEPLDGLSPGDGEAADVTIRFRVPSPWEHASPARELYRGPAVAGGRSSLVVEEREPGFTYRYADGTTFHVARDAREVWATVTPPVPVAGAAVYLTGPVLGFVLRRMGTLCLHASANVVGSRAIAFVGAPGAGKSTTAAAFAMAGHAALSDDLVALRRSGAQWIASPALDHLRLWPDGATVLFDDPAALPRVSPDWDKRKVALGEGALPRHEGAVPLGALVLLGPRGGDEATAIVRVADASAALAILRETYANYALTAGQRAEELRQVGALLGRVPVFTVSVPSTRPALREFAARMAATLAAAAQPA